MINEQFQQQQHPRCIVCGKQAAAGWELDFRHVAGTMVEADFPCDRALEGYPWVLHGGVICTLLDGAMTNCLFAAGQVAMTGDLHVRFRKPVVAVGSACVRAWIEESTPPLYKLAAHLEQDGEIKATARARFMQRAEEIGLSES